MKRIDMILLGFKNISRNKFRSVLYISIMGLFFTLLIGFYSVISSLSKYIVNAYNSDLDYKSLSVYIDDRDRDQILAEINKMNLPVNDIIRSSLLANFGAMSTNFNNEYFTFKGYYESNHLIIDEGRKPEAKNEIICPSSFYSGYRDDLQLSDTINMKKEIGKKVNISYHKLLKKKNGDTEDLKTLNYDFTIVGTYNVNAMLMGDYGLCFVQPEMLNEMASERLTEYELEEDEKKASIDSPIILLFKEYKDIHSALQKLLDAGYHARYSVTLDTDFLDLIINNSNYLFIGFNIVALICIVLFIKNYYKNNWDNIILYKILGYENKIIYKLSFYEFFILTFLSFLFGFFLVSLFLIAFSLFIKKYLFYNVLKASLSLTMALFYFIILIILIIVILIYQGFHINNMSVAEMLGEKK